MATRDIHDFLIYDLGINEHLKGAEYLAILITYWDLKDIKQVDKAMQTAANEIGFDPSYIRAEIDYALNDAWLHASRYNGWLEMANKLGRRGNITELKSRLQAIRLVIG